MLIKSPHPPTCSLSCHCVLVSGLLQWYTLLHRSKIKKERKVTFAPQNCWNHICQPYVTQLGGDFCLLWCARHLGAWFEVYWWAFLLRLLIYTLYFTRYRPLNLGNHPNKKYHLVWYIDGKLTLSVYAKLTENSPVNLEFPTFLTLNTPTAWYGIMGNNCSVPMVTRPIYSEREHQSKPPSRHVVFSFINAALDLSRSS